MNFSLKDALTLEFFLSNNNKIALFNNCIIKFIYISVKFHIFFYFSIAEFFQIKEK